MTDSTPDASALVPPPVILSTPPADPLDFPAQIEFLQSQLDSITGQLLESQRLATIGTISAVIAHEFNNLLTPIISYSQFALQSAESANPDLPLIRKALSKSQQAATKAGRICASMLGLARGESNTGPVEVQSLVDETLLVLARDPKKDGVALRVQIHPGTRVIGDAVQLEQVLLNLIINAMQAMASAKGANSLTIKAAPVDPLTTGPNDPREVRIQVIDTGPGIAARNLPRIFDPFFTTKGTAKKGEAKGTGLGLTICRQIIENHKGRIEVASEQGKGTTFTLLLPADPAAGEPTPSPLP